tara:strand:- start:373 stop:2226 length:1854 start_codon:yes stop_codon:yes gene_type:complete
MANGKKQGLQPILGRADATLVNAAYKAAVANKPVDMRQQFQNVASVHASMLNSISQNFKSVVESDKLYNQEMIDTLDPLYDQFENGTLNDGLLESRLGKLEAFKEEWKKIPRGKAGETARSKWRNKVNRYLADQKGIIGTLVDAGALSKNGELHDLSAKDAQTVTAVANLHAGKTGDGATAVEVENPDGTTSFTITPKTGDPYTVTSDELKNILPIKYHKSAENFVNINTNVLKDGKTSGLEYGDDEKIAVSNDVVNFIENQGENKSAAYRSATLYKDGGMRMSFKEALYDKEGLAPALVDGLIEAGQIQDENNDGTVDKKDIAVMNEASFNAMADAILKDYRVGSRILGDWYANTEGQRQFDKGKKTRRGSGTGTGDDTSFTSIASSKGQVQLTPQNDGNIYFNAKQLDQFSKDMIARKDFDLGSSGKFVWKENFYGEGQGSYVNTSNNKPMSKKVLFKALTNTGDKEFTSAFVLSKPYANVEDWFNPGGFSEKRELVKDKFDVSNLATDDNAVRDQLNKLLPRSGTMANEKGYRFELTKTALGRFGAFQVGDFTEDAIILVDSNNQPVRDPQTNQPIKIMTNLSSTEEQENEMAKLKKLLGREDVGLLDNLVGLP